MYTADIYYDVTNIGKTASEEEDFKQKIGRMLNEVGKQRRLLEQEYKDSDKMLKDMMKLLTEAQRLVVLDRDDDAAMLLEAGMRDFTYE